MTRTMPFMMAVVSLCATGLVGACSSSWGLLFTVSERADATETYTVALPEGANVQVSNEDGSTYVTVDPAADVATVEVTRIARADTKEAADALLEHVVVTVSEPAPSDNALRINAPVPNEATGRDSEHEVEYTAEGTQIRTIEARTRLASVDLRVTLPPGHPVQVVQGSGRVRAVALDCQSTLSANSGWTSLIGARATVSITSRGGPVEVQDHRGSLDVRSEHGPIAISLADLPADGRVTAKTSGGIALTVPASIDADLYALSEYGEVRCSANEFGAFFGTATSSLVAGQLNAGGPLIDLRATYGDTEVSATKRTSSTIR